MSSEFAAAAEQWATDGWCLVEGLVPESDIDAAAEDLETLYGTNTFDDYNKASRFGDGTPNGKQFRGSQFDGMRGFPLEGCPRLNDLYVHERVVAFACAALQDDDVRIYQAAAWGKWAGAINYEQPIHRDLNHSLLPLRMEPGYWNLETFLYLSDVDEDCAPPRLVPNSAVAASDDELYEREIAAMGKRGSLLAYRSDVWHRGTDFAREDASRFVLAIGFRPASADWFSYDAFGRYGNNFTWIQFAADKTPDELALFGVPRPGHHFWTADTVDGLAEKYPGLDVTPWRDALA